MLPPARYFIAGGGRSDAWRPRPPPLKARSIRLPRPMADPQLLNFRGVQPEVGSNSQKLKSFGGSHRPRPGAFVGGEEHPAGKAHETEPGAAVLLTHHPLVGVRGAAGPGPSRAFPEG
ncbi:MAG: hypothetical protein ACK56F_20015, partial [bacterium]